MRYPKEGALLTTRAIAVPSGSCVPGVGRCATTIPDARFAFLRVIAPSEHLASLISAFASSIRRPRTRGTTQGAGDDDDGTRTVTVVHRLQAQTHLYVGRVETLQFAGP